MDSTPNYRIENRFRELLAEKSRRDRHDWTYEEIYEETGISPTTLVRLAQQKHKMISFDLLAGLCAFFNCKISDLLLLVEEDRTDEPGQRVAVAVR